GCACPIFECFWECYWHFCISNSAFEGSGHQVHFHSWLFFDGIFSFVVHFFICTRNRLMGYCCSLYITRYCGGHTICSAGVIHSFCRSNKACSILRCCRCWWAFLGKHYWLLSDAQCTDIF